MLATPGCLATNKFCVLSTALGEARSDLTPNQASYTFSAVSIGADPPAGSRRFVVVIAQLVSTSAITANVSTIGGVSATAFANSTNSSGGFTCRVNVRWAEIPTGSTADIVIASSTATEELCTIVAYVITASNGGSLLGGAITNAASTSAGVSTTNTTLRTGGICFRHLLTRSSTPSKNVSATCTGVTEDVDVVVDASTSVLLHSAHYDSPQPYSANFSSSTTVSQFSGQQFYDVVTIHPKMAP